MEGAVRRIYVVRHRAYGQPRPFAFSQRRQAERYIESLPKKAWKEATDLEAMGRAWADRVRYAVRDYGADHPYVHEVQTSMRREMDRIRAVIDRGYQEFRQTYTYNYGDLPFIEEMEMFRTLAEYHRQ